VAEIQVTLCRKMKRLLLDWYLLTKLSTIFTIVVVKVGKIYKCENIWPDTESLIPTSKNYYIVKK